MFYVKNAIHGRRDAQRHGGKALHKRNAFVNYRNSSLNDMKEEMSLRHLCQDCSQIINNDKDVEDEQNVCAEIKNTKLQNENFWNVSSKLHYPD